MKSTLSLVAVILIMLSADTVALAASSTVGEGDWPQYRGPNRDNIAVNSPPLRNTWPKEGPPLAWKSDLIPGWYQGGCSGPVLADGKVFVYSTSKLPLGGSTLFKPITADILTNAGWLADLPPDLSKKIEDARTSPARPKTSNRGAYFPWWGVDVKAKDKERDEYLAKKPELDKYIKDFIATLNPEEARKYGDYVRKRLCMTPESVYGEGNGFTPAALAKLSKLQDVGYSTCREAAGKIQAASGAGTLFFHLDNGQFFDSVWLHCFTRTDALFCLDANTGKTLWKKEFQLDNEAVSNLNKERHTSVLGVCATPAVWNGRVYFVGAAGLNCVSAKDGTLLWQVKHKPEQASPLVADGIVYHCGCAYNAETGQVLWKTPRDNGGCYGPTLGVFGGRKYIFAAGSGAIHCLDLQTGKENWTTKYTSTWTMEGATSGDVLIGDGKMYKMTPSGIQLDKTLVDFKGMSFGLSWIIHQDHLYRYVFAAEGNPKNSKIDGLCCFDLKSGDLKWAYRGPTCTWDTDYTPSILADGKIIGSFGSGANFMWENDGVAMYQATPEKYTLLGSFKPGLIPWTPMAYGGGRLLVRTEAGISCYDLR